MILKEWRQWYSSGEKVSFENDREKFVTCQNKSFVAIRKWCIFLAGIVVLGLLLNSCDGKRKNITIGIISEEYYHAPAIEGFKAGMAELNYIEGENVTYIQNDDTGPKSEAIDKEIDELMAQHIDILVCMGSQAALRARQAVEGTDIPVVFGSVLNPVAEGVVDSRLIPGGNLTGVQVGMEVSKALEWMTMIIPNLRKVYVPYNPDDDVSVKFLTRLASFAPQYSIEFVFGKVQSVEEAVAAIESLPPEMQAVFRVPSPTLDLGHDELSQAAVNRKIPMFSSHPLDGTGVLSLSTDLLEGGKLAARITDKILHGMKPSGLPLETPEINLAVNLKIARDIGLDIPDIVVSQADEIIR